MCERLLQVLFAMHSIKSFLLVILAGITVFLVHQTFQTETCYQRNQKPYSFFGSKTSYSFVSGTDLNTPSDCHAVQIWMMSRHGTRYPSKEMIMEFKTKLNLLKSNISSLSPMCWEDINAIRNWNVNLSSLNHYSLHDQGVKELKTLALKLKQLFPQIFNTSYKDSKFKFLSTSKPRALASATVFYQSLFNENPKMDLPTSKSDDRINLSKCKAIDDDDNMESEEEVKKFEKGPLVQSVISRVSKKMGLNQNIMYGDVKLMFESCKYEKAWSPDSHPPWCALFSTNDLEILEYLEDLKYYYKNGYGNSVALHLGCPIVKDLLENFKNNTQKQIGPLGIFYFGHTPNILSIVTQLRIAKDDSPLLSTNFDHMKNRRWKISYINPFASNIIAVFYKCQEGNKVMFLLNEHVIPMNKESCKLCPWEPIRNMLNTTISNQTCNLKFCSSSTSIISKNKILTLLSLFYTLFFNFYA
ncbi:multiple inositol polyphosphate phosphatase 1-like [Daktulosphaira vitifoliae]|uniref:multiple inositol polyphosphate phosphatase 1-like n=1 Tax=Daktulosphaira vitifoliae TaxID=58002 RepID=UPI0021A98B43|nr:multiple inositol polyphosphate phosphatase 1-like [Daktulosphaira vitifoliae]